MGSKQSTFVIKGTEAHRFTFHYFFLVCFECLNEARGGCALDMGIHALNSG